MTDGAIPTPSLDEMTEEHARPTPSLEDKDAVRQRIEEWLPEHMPELTNVKLSELEIPEGTGMSNVTILFDAEFESAKGKEKHAFVGRLEPKGEKLVFPRYDLGLQYAIMEAVGIETDIPIPPLLAEDRTGDILGVPFFIMEKVAGIVPPDMPPYHMDGWVCEADSSVRENLWWRAVDAMADFHKVDTKQGKFAELIESFEFPKSLDEQIAYWENYYTWGLEGHKNAACDNALEYLKANKPTDNTQQLCWGDSRMSNVLFKEDKSDVAALLDWEMLTLGNPQQDIAWWIFMDELFSTGLGAPRLEGIPGREETAKRWSELTGYGTDDLDYYLVFAGYRFSVMLARVSIIRGDTDFIAESFASNYLATLH